VRAWILSLVLLAPFAAAPAHAWESGVEAELSQRRVEDPGAVWSEANLQELAWVLSEAYSHGFPSMEAESAQIADASARLGDRVRVARDAFRRYAGWLRYGMVDPETMELRYLDAQEREFITVTMRRALIDDNVYEALNALAPPVRDYEILRQEMIRRTAHQRIFPVIGEGAALRLGDEGERVDQLRARLAAEGLLVGEAVMGAPFDARLDTAVRRFQGRVNLAPTGVADRDTLAQLNMTPDRRLEQLRANLEQRRWRSRDLGRRHIWVNLADFSLEAWEDGRLARRHEVMVGREASSTPEFSEEMQYLVLNPWWNVPGGSGSVRFRAIRRNPGFARQYRIIHRDGRAVPVSQVDWSRWGNDWPYRLAQPPGPENPMGEVKFIFPNRHNVYIHDTVERDEFFRTRRDFSAGCIRVQDPMALAAWVLEEQDEAWSRDRIETVASGNEPTVVWLDNRIAVHIAYWTVVGDDDGTVRFLNDLYDRDARQTAGVSQAVGRLANGERPAPPPPPAPIAAAALD
jgi:murein L,D-transpeptidase YcbB/YkuD